MSLKDIIRNDLHMNNLYQKIKILQNNCNLKGWLSGPYPKMLCDVLLEDIDIYYSEIHNNTLNNIKSQGALQFEDIEIYTNSNVSSLNKLLDIDLKILDNELNITSRATEQLYKNTMKNFEENFNKKADNLCINFKTECKEYMRKQKQDLLNQSIAISSLNAAKSSKTAAWVFGIITTIISITALYISIRK